MKLKKYSKQKSESLAKKIASYSAITGAFMASAASADAQVVYVDVNPDSLIQGSTFDLDLNNDGTVDFVLHQFTSSAAANPYRAARINGAAGQFANGVIGYVGAANFFYPSRLSNGFLIASGAPNWITFSGAPNNAMSLGYAYLTGNSFGQWNGMSGFAGLRFVAGANTHYGWAEMEVGSDATTLVLKGYAYEQTAGTQIIAGDTGLVSVEENGNIITSVGMLAPNPVVNRKSKLAVVSKDNSEIKADVMNGIGELVATESRKVVMGKNILDFDFSGLSSGTYFLRISGDKSSTVFRKFTIAD